jgi:hypothetical protein
MHQLLGAKMNFDTANSIYQQLVACDNHLNNILEIIEKLEPGDEKNEFRRAVANIVGLIYSDISLPIEKSHPYLAL